MVTNLQAQIIKKYDGIEPKGVGDQEVVLSAWWLLPAIGRVR